MRPALLAALLLATAPSALAQSAPPAPPASPDVLADSLVVTATRRPEDLRRTGRAVTVVTAEDIARAPASSLDELLRTAAGVEVLARGPLGAQADLTIRGSTFGGVLLLLDGVRADDPQTGHFLTDFPVPLAEIARIEVLRGPAAALYGPDAVGGVVHILTKTALGIPSGQLAVQAGAHALRASEFATALPFGRLTGGLAAASLRTDGEAVESVDGGTMRGRSGDAVRADLDRRALTGALRFQMRRGVATFRAATDERSYGSVRHYSASRLDTAFSTASTLWLQTAYRGALGPRLGLEASAGLRRHESTYTFNPATAANAHDNRQGTALVALHLAATSALAFDAGLTAAHRSIESNNMGSHAATAVGAFVQARFVRGPLAAALAVRVDRDAEGFGTEATPQASLAYTAGRVTVRAAGGRAVRAPSFTERYYNTQVAKLRGRDVGNPDLAAERAWNAEAGLDVAAAPGLTLRATGFWRDTDNLIDFVKTNAADTVFRARNLLAVTARGAELEAAWRRGPLSAGVAYTYLDLTRDASAVVASKYALSNARHLVQLNAAGTLAAGAARGLTVGASAFVRTPTANPPAAPGTANPRTEATYAVLNLRAAYPLPLRRLPLTVTVELRNATGTRYVELFAPVMGRWWIVGVKVGG